LKNKKFGFTLAEIMIVLSIIGILTAILMPIAFHSAPDQNVMKFKKANATVGTIVRELVSSSVYFAEGDLSKTKDNTDVTAKSLCNAIADIVSVKKQNCSDKNTGDNYRHIDCATCDTQATLDTNKKAIDTKCAEVQSTVGAEIVTTDDVEWFQSNPAWHFASKWTDDTYHFKHEYNGFLRNYKILCFDIDGIGKGEAPFGYAIRVDGKIITGERADKWLEKDFQKGKNE